MKKTIYLISLLFTLSFVFLFTINSYSQTLFKGKASYYSNKFDGKKTATGYIFSNENFTASSNVLPLRSIVKVTNIKNHKHVIVYLNDRMKKSNHRLIDVSKAAAMKLHFMKQGICEVEVQIISFPVMFNDNILQD